jgi:HlyD family secretion protein
MRRLVKWLVALGVLATGIVAAGFVGQQYLKAKSAPRFTTATVSTGNIETVVNSTGPVKPVLSVSVGSFVSGPIKDIKVDFNSVVKKDDLLAVIDERLLKAAFDRETAALATAQAELGRIEAQLKQAERNENRGLRLRQTNPDYISEQEMDQLLYNRMALEAQKKLAEANIQAAKASLKNAETNLEYTNIKSPVDGVVIDRKVEPGQTVASAFQIQEMFIIAPDLNTMHVYASVDEADIGQIIEAQKQNRPVKFTVDAYREEVFTGKIFQIRMNATTTQNVVTYPVIVEAPNPGLKLRNLMTASVSFQIDVRDNVTRVPMAAIRYVPPDNLIRPEDKLLIDGKVKKDPKEGEEKLSAERRAEQARARNKRVVWIQEGQTLVAVPIVIGLMDGQWAELVSGDIKVGQQLVTGIEGDDERARR